MLSNTNAPLFEITQFGIDEPSAINLPENGRLFACVTAGQCELNVRRQRIGYSVGMAFVHGCGASLQLSGNGKIVYCVVNGAFSDQLCDVSGIYDGFGVLAMGSSEELFRICALMKENPVNTAELLFCFHCFIKKIADAKISEEKRNVDIAVMMKEYIDSHASGKLTLQEMSDVFFISKTQIFRIFKSYFDTTPMQYYLQKKIDVSKKMLVEDNMKVADIAESLGFSDPKHYSKTFKRFVGKLPKEYRKVNRTTGLGKLITEDGFKNELS